MIQVHQKTADLQVQINVPKPAERHSMLFYAVPVQIPAVPDVSCNLSEPVSAHCTLHPDYQVHAGFDFPCDDNFLFYR